MAYVSCLALRSNIILAVHNHVDDVDAEGLEFSRPATAEA